MNKCLDCDEDKVDVYDYCKNCIVKKIRVCTCNKKFIEETPSIINIGEGVYTIPEKIPDYFFIKLRDYLYHIVGCRGCKYGEISVQNNFTRSLQASIVSCVYQKLETDGVFRYEYISDALDPGFEKYLQENDIKVGLPADIEINVEKND